MTPIYKKILDATPPEVSRMYFAPEHLVVSIAMWEIQRAHIPAENPPPVRTNAGDVNFIETFSIEDYR